MAALAALHGRAGMQRLATALGVRSIRLLSSNRRKLASVTF